jgi:hypothetical protein
MSALAHPRKVSPRKQWLALRLLACLNALFLATPALAHPSSGIVVDAQGHVFVVQSGVVRIDPGGQLVPIYSDTGGHWLALDPTGSFSRTRPKPFDRITPDGATPALIYASGGSPIAMGADGNLYYATDGSPGLPAGALAVGRLTPAGEQSLFAPDLQTKLREHNDGITAMAAGPGSTLLVATWKGAFQLAPDGSIARTLYPITTSDCDRDPADHNPANAASPFFRGIAADPAGNIYLAATSCHLVIKIHTDGRQETLLRSSRPWSPTGLTFAQGTVYVLEYTHANGPRSEGWRLRVRRLGANGKWQTLAQSPERPPPAPSRSEP